MPKFVNAQHLHFPTRLPKAQAFEAVRQIEVAARFARTKCSELHQLIAAGAHDDAQTHIETLLNSPQFVLACIPRAARNFPADKRPLLESHFGIASDVLPIGSSRMAAKLKTPKKANGEHRPIWVFDMRSRVSQETVRRVLTPYFVPRKWQYSHLGVPAAIKAIKAMSGKSGWWVAKLDIKKNFESFEFEKLLNELPLQTEVVEMVVIGRRIMLRDSGGSLSHIPRESIMSAARRGIPQGSICSPVIANIFATKLGEMKGNFCLFNYADDFLLCAPSEKALLKASDKLIAEVAALPGGTFTLIPKQFGKLPDEFAETINFLGYRLYRYGTKICAGVSGAAAEKYSANLNEIDDRLQYSYRRKMPPAATVEAIAEFRAYTLAWCAAFSAADDIGEFMGQAENTFRQYLKDFNVPVQLVQEVLKIMPPVKIEEVGSGV